MSLFTHSFARFYDLLLEPMLRHWKQRLSLWVREQKADVVVDICCGTGKQCRLIARHTGIVGLDLNIGFLHYAKSLSPNISYVCGDAEHLPLKSGALSATIISLALHDKPPATRAQMLSEAKRISNPGTHFFIDFEQPDSLPTKLGYAFVFCIEFLAGWEHFRNGRQFVKNGGLAQFLNQNNLTIDRRHHSTSGSSAVVQCSSGQTQ